MSLIDIINGWWKKDRIVETAPPSTMANRRVLSLRRPLGSRLLVVSTPSSAGAGNHRLDYVDIDPSTGFTWGQSLDDASFPYTGSAWVTPVQNDGEVQIVMGSLKEARVYLAGPLPPVLAGTIQPEDGGHILALGAWSGRDSIVVMSNQGRISSHNAFRQQDGTPIVTSSGSPPSSPKPNIAGAVFLTPGEYLFEEYNQGTFGLAWWVSPSYTYSQLVQDTNRLLGQRNFYVRWAGAVFDQRFLLTQTDHGRLRLYYHPGTGGNGSWKLMRHVLGGTPPANFFVLPEIGARWDAWADDGPFPSPSAPPIRLVTTDSSKVTRLTIIPDVPSLTYRTSTDSTRNRVAHFVAWYKDDPSRARHVELLLDGTLRLVETRGTGGGLSLVRLPYSFAGRPHGRVLTPPR